MQKSGAGAAALLALFTTSAHAGDRVLTGPVPDWVAASPETSLDALPRSGNAIPKFDEQVRIDGDTVTTYVDVATVISSQEALTKVGTISAKWQPDHGDLTFHRIEIIRSGAVIDALKGGEGFTVLRREAQLENRVIDGQLTAMNHIEDLRIGDVVRVAFSVSIRDSSLKGNVQDALLLLPEPLRIGFGRARLVWPQGREIALKSRMPDVAVNPKVIPGNLKEVVVVLPVPKLPEMPKNIPSRFEPLPLIEFSSFKNWQGVADVMAPLYRVTGAISAGTDLSKAVDAIAARSSDPVQRMADALQLVQNDVRYQLVAMGTGNYVPQTPADTWSKRYGDCKAKTLLLLAILDRLGISAEPVLANLTRGDAVADALPSVRAFDHIFVRAQVGTETFWLDGTMQGSRLPDIRDVPRYGFVLPLFAKNAALVNLPQRADARPATDLNLTYDMSAGPHLPAPYTLEIRYSGPWAEKVKVAPGGDYDEQLRKYAESAAKSWTGSNTIGRPRAEYDPVNAVWTLNVEGVAYPDWKFRDGHYELALVPSLKVVLEAERGRAAWQKIPGIINQPWTAHSRVTLQLPNAGKELTIRNDEPTRLSFPAVEWVRTVTKKDGELVEEITSRESGREVPPGEISATGRTISDCMERAVGVELPPTYPQRWVDVTKMRSAPALARVRAIYDRRISERPDDPDRMADRAWLANRLLDWDAAESDYSSAIALDASAARYLDRADLRADRGDHAGALKDAQAAYDLEPGNKEARSLLATELAEIGKVDEGIDLLPPDPDLTTGDGMNAFLNRINVLERGNRHQQALALLDSALVKHTSNADLHNFRCWYQALHNDGLIGALADCNRAIELSSDPANFLESRALVHLRAERWADAEADLQEVLAISPEQSTSLFMHGIVLERLGKTAEGKSQIRAARLIYPGINRHFEKYGIAP